MLKEYLNHVKFLCGKDALLKTGYGLKYLGATRPLILSDMSTLKTGYTKRVKKALSLNDIKPICRSVEGRERGIVKDAEYIAREYRDNKCDSIIAVGNSGVIDSCKGARLLLTSGKEKFSELSEIDCSVSIPFAVIPTMMGSASCASARAIIFETLKNKGYDLADTSVAPDIVVIDSNMQDKMPLKMVAEWAIYALNMALCVLIDDRIPVFRRVYADAAIDLVRKHYINASGRKFSEEDKLALMSAVIYAGAAFADVNESIAAVIALEIGRFKNAPFVPVFNSIAPYYIEMFASKSSSLGCGLLRRIAGTDTYLTIPKAKREEVVGAAVRTILANAEDKYGYTCRLREYSITVNDFDAIIDYSLNKANVKNESEIRHIMNEMLNRAL